MKKLVLLLIAVLTIAYPLLVYFGLNHFSPAIIAVLLLIIGIARFVFAKNKSEPLVIATLLLLSIYSLLVIVLDSSWLLLLYPVVVSFGVAGVFAISLGKDVTLIESFAIAAGKTITANAKRYTRKLTLVWVVLLVANGLVALYLALFASLAAWALYCGLLSYCVMGAFFAAEFIYRQYYIKRMGQ